MRNTAFNSVVAGYTAKDSSGVVGPGAGIGSAKAGFIVDRYLKVFEFLGDASAFLKSAPDRSRPSLCRLLHPELLRPLLESLREARTHSEPVRREQIRLRGKAKTPTVNLVVCRLHHHSHHSFAQPAMRILIEEAEPAPAVESVLNHAMARARVPDRRPATDARLKHVEQDLWRTRAIRESLILHQDAGLLELREAYKQLEVLKTESAARQQQLAAAGAEIEALHLRLRAAVEQRDMAQKQGR